MVKLSFIKSEFIQNNDKTVCKLTCSFRESTKGDYLPIPYQLCKKYRLGNNAGKNFIIIGKSKRHEDDNDSIIGKYLAESRAKKKAYEKAKKVLNEYVLMIEKDLRILDLKECTQKLEELTNKESIHIDKLIGDHEI